MERRAKLYPIAPGVTCINDADESVCYVVCGSERAAVIDTVNGMENLYDIVREVTDLPLIVIDTHGHCDHVWGNGYFEEAYIHPADIAIHDSFFAQRPDLTPCPLKPIREGEVVDLGDRKLEVILVDGHTPGSICLLDRKDGFLYSGDAINGQAWLQLDHSSSLKVYLESLNALDAYRPFFTELHNGHNVEAIPAAYIDEVREGVKTILATGGAGDEDYEWFGGVCKRHMLREDAWILYTPDKL